MIQRPPPPDLPEDDLPPPDTEPRGALDPPRRGPPTAVVAAKPPPPIRFEPSWYRPGFGGTQRGARLTLAVALGAGALISASVALPALVTVALGGWALRSAWAFGAGEEVERSLRRRWRWLRRVRRRTAQAPEVVKLWVW